MRPYLPRFALAVLAFNLGTNHGFARIGESRSSLENRLIEKGGAINVSNGQVYQHLLQKTPFTAALPPDDKEVTVAIYYKKADDERAFASQLLDDRDQPLKNPPGWILYVAYYQGQSMLEYYRKPGGITEAETNGILLLNRGSANWVRQKLPETENPGDDYESILPHNLHRSDYRVLANATGDGLLIFNVGFENHLGKLKREREKEAAPDSLAGF